MADRATEKRARAALADLESGDYQAVAAFLARLGDVAAPELAAARDAELAAARRKIESLERQLAAAVENALRATAAAMTDAPTPRPVRSVPKPTRRIEDRDALAAFRRQHDRCAILGCAEGDADPHHIIPRSHARSSDDERNLLNLHRGHHDEWHAIGREAFVAKYAGRLAPLDLLKIRLAAEIEEVARLNGREAVDLDAEGM